MNNLGDIIKIYRINKNYRQDYVANKINITQSTYSKIENNKSLPSIQTLYKLSKVLDFSIDKALDMVYSKEKIYKIKSANLKNYLFLSLKNHKE